jgi:hypothetical protein
VVLVLVLVVVAPRAITFIKSCFLSPICTHSKAHNVSRSGSGGGGGGSTIGHSLRQALGSLIGLLQPKELVNDWGQ